MTLSSSASRSSSTHSARPATSPDPSATDSKFQSYKNVYSDEIEAEGWTLKADGSDADHDQYLPRIKIIDVATATEVENWEIEIPSSDDDHEAYAEEARTQLRRDADKHLSTRVVIFSDGWLDFIQDTIGFVHNIHPHFFHDVSRTKSHRTDPGFTYYSEWPQHDEHLDEMSLRTRVPHLSTGDGWIAKVDRASTFLPNVQNIVFICCPLKGLRPMANVNLRRSGLFPHYDWTNLVDKLRDNWPRWERKSVDCSELVVSRIQGFTEDEYQSAIDDPTLYLLPVLEISFILSVSEHAYSHFELLRRHRALADAPLTSLTIKELELLSNAMSELVYNALRPLNRFEKYDLDSNQGNAMQHASCELLRQKNQKLYAEVVKANTFAKDMLQACVTHLSLLDSKASIEQSKLAIEESQKTKLVTLLASIFVPVALSASIFGMNIQELNGNGLSIWVFIVTTVIITFGTGFLWAFFYQYRIWYRSELGEPEQRGSDDDASGNVSWRYRLKQLLRLIRAGHWFWIWNSGIVYSLATSGKRSFAMSCRVCDLTWLKGDHLQPEVLNCSVHDAHSPCSYIVTHLESESAKAFSRRDLTFEERWADG